MKLGDLILLVVDFWKGRGKFAIHKQVHDLLRSSRVSLDGELEFRGTVWCL